MTSEGRGIARPARIGGWLPGSGDLRRVRCADRRIRDRQRTEAMLRRLVQKLKRLTVEAVPFDPSGLGDDIALRTEWGPAKGGGASFGTHRLEQVDPYRTEFRPTRGAMAFYLLFVLVGLAVIVGFAIANMSRGLPANWSSAVPLVVPVVFGSVFTIVGGGMLYVGAAPIVFDKRRGDYWKGRVAPYEVSTRREMKDHVKLERIHALQIISEYCRSDKSSYYSYELNLVLDDGSRMNVIDHGNQSQLRDDAHALAAFLDKPVWDATA